MKRWLPAAAVAGLTAVTVAHTWRTWPDPAIDFGSQLYYAWRLSAGQRLYTDIAYFNGPLSQWFNAALFRIFGVGLMTIVWANLLILVGVIVMAYRTSGAAAAAVFVAAFSCAQYVGISGYNWVCPYTHEVTHGVALAMAAVMAVSSPRRWMMPLTGLCVGLCFLTKAEIFAPTVFAIGVGLVLRRATVKGWITVVVTAAIPVSIAFAILASYMPSADALRATLGSWPWVFDRQIAQLAFYRKGLGVDNLPENLREMAVVAAGYVIGAGLIFGAAGAGPSVVMPKPIGSRPRLARVQQLMLGMSVVGAIVMCIYARWMLLAVARPWPILLMVVAIVTVRSAWRTPAERGANGAVMAVLAAGLLAKMAFNPRVWHYGFALAAPAAMVLVDTAVRRFPAWAAARGGNATTARAAAGLLITGLVAGLWIEQIPVANKSAVVGTGVDQFQADLRGTEIEQCRKVVASLVPPSATMAVLPQGLMMNYLDRRIDPVRVTTVMPPEVITFGDDRLLADLRSHPPDVVVLAERYTSDGGLLLDDGHYIYARSILNWVTREYQQRTTAVPNSELRLSVWTHR